MYLKKITKEHLKRLYEVIYSSDKPKWTEFNAPYFNEYKFISYNQFLISNEASWVQSDDVLGIFEDDNIIGVVTRNWIDKNTRWLEIGIVIYDENYWDKGIGYKALKTWLGFTFRDFPEIARLGLTTWSGNFRMMQVAEKLGMKEEGRIRKVRYYNGYYYDSMKYGILREEFVNMSS